MNLYEKERQENIDRNKALLAELDIKRLKPEALHRNKPPTKKRKLTVNEASPTRASARIASAPKPSYKDEPDVAPQERRISKSQSTNGVKCEVDSPVPAKDIDSIRFGWTSWKPTGSVPTRDETGTFHFSDAPAFTPNKSPAEVLREGAFGGSYYRPLYSRTLGSVIENDWKELPSEWLEGLNVELYLTSKTYNPDVNKFKVSCGQSIEEWEAAGWIRHDFDVRGWFQWYCRFFEGRRCEDDERQVSRWRKCVGETGRWRRMLLKKYRQLGVREVWDDGEDDRVGEVSPVMHQTCHHWAWEVRQGELDEMWASL